MPHVQLDRNILEGFKSLDPEMLEWWSIGALNKDTIPLAITPTLHYSITPKSFEIKIPK